MSHIASVVISNCTREFDKEYHYAIPLGMEEEVKPGMRVMVPFGGGNKLLEAYVLQLVDRTPFSELKEIKEVLDVAPVLDDRMLALAVWMKERYICTYSDAIRCMLPAGIGMKSQKIVRLLESTAALSANAQKVVDLLREFGGECEYEELREHLKLKSFSRYMQKLSETGWIEWMESYTPRVREKRVRVACLLMPVDEIAEEIENGRIKKIQQIRVLEMLMENEFIAVQDIMRFAGVSGSVLDTLRKHGYIYFKDIEVKRDPLKHMDFKKTVPLKPTCQQSEVLHAVKARLDSGEYSDILLHGVTGSGKTEVYLQLIQHVIECGKQAIVLVPEISLTPQMVERFKGRFGNDVAVLHSRLSLGERYDQWRLIKEGRIKVAVGARSAVFAPFQRLGMIIVDEEHESSYKSETTPKYHAVEIARKRCSDTGAVLLMGSATPSVETYDKACRGGIGLMVLDQRANRMAMPDVEIVDMRRELEGGNRSMFSGKLSEEIRKNIEAGQQTILFLNRRGYASFVLCRNCGYVLKCTECSIAMTYHAFDERLVCHYCGYTVRMPAACPRCKSSHIRQFGTGTQKVEEELKRQFEGCSVIRMDMDTTTGKNSHEEILRSFREQNINILVGTQMIAKGHDFPNVTLVGVLAADSMLNMGDYRATERTFQLLTQVSGRAGRGSLPGRVIVQTYNTEDFSILTACRNDYIAFFKQEIKVREKLGYPPFCHLAVLVVSGSVDRSAFDAAKSLKEDIRACFSEGEEAEVLGPTRSPVAKIRHKYRWRIIVKYKNLDRLISELSTVADRFNRKKGYKETTELSMDINPYNMI